MARHSEFQSRPCRTIYQRYGVPFDVKSSSDIPVEQLEITLALPLLIQARKRLNGDLFDPALCPSRSDFLEHWVAEITRNSVWQPLKTNYPATSGAEREPSYAEFVYFHPFVRNFLYLTRGDIREYFRKAEKQSQVLSKAQLFENATNRNLRILARDDLESMHVEVSGLQAVFKIPSCWMYLFDTQIAMVELELRLDQKPGDQKWSLNDVMLLQDVIRRTSSAYWSVFDKKVDATNYAIRNNCHVPSKLTLIRKPSGSKPDSDHTPVVSSFGNLETTDVNATQIREQGWHRPVDLAGHKDDDPATSVEKHIEHVLTNREPYTIHVWRTILEPLAPTMLGLVEENGAVREDVSGPNLRYEHIEDDRTTLFSYISIGNKDIRRISTGDWLRLANVDDPGDSATYPYSPTFFSDQENPLSGFAYDRFWHPTGEPPAQTYQNTRWLCSGYGFSGVGDSESPFFTDAHAGALCNFRHHYFALGMIAQFHRASLLMYKHRLAEAADSMLASPVGSDDSDWNKRLREIDFRAKAEELSKEIMRFRTLYWFSEVSNQVQGRELFNKFREHLNLGELFNEVTSDSEAAVSLLRQWDTEDNARSTAKLGILAAILIVAGPLLSNFGALFGNGWSSTLGITLMIFGLVIFFNQFPTHSLRTDNESSRKNNFARRLRNFGNRTKLRNVLSIVSICIGAILLIVSLLNHHDDSVTTTDLKDALEVNVKNSLEEISTHLKSIEKEQANSRISPIVVPILPPFPTSQPPLNSLPTTQLPNVSPGSARPDASNSTTNDSGQNPIDSALQPQNPNLGSAPPNQQAPSGDASASPETMNPSP